MLTKVTKGYIIEIERTNKKEAIKMKIQYCYITKKDLGCGEALVEGRKADGSLLFGSKRFLSFDWHGEARRLVPSAYIPVFGSGKPASLV